MVDLVRRHAPPRVPGEPVLDVGCGFGFLLARLGDGFTRCGMDLSAHAVAEAGRRLTGARLVQANVEEGIPFRAAFRAVLAVNVIEHLHRPGAAVRNIRAALAPGGVCVVHLPTVSTPLNRLVYRYTYAGDPTHVYRPSGDEVVDLFRGEGMSLLEESYAPHAPRALWNALKPHPAYLAAFRREGSG